MTDAIKVILEYDDLHPHPEVDCLDFADKIIKKYPKIIINFFTVSNYNNQAIYSDGEWCDRLKRHIDNGNICLCVHGYTHSPLEFKHLNYRDAYHRIVKAEQKFLTAQLPFKKVFRAPQWGINSEVMLALHDLNYTHVYSHTDYTDINNYYSNFFKIVYYNWNLKDDFQYDKLENPIQNDIVVIHGHTHNVCENGIEESYARFENFMSRHSVEFARCDEY